MNDGVGETLAAELSRRGVALVGSLRRLEGLLRDLHPADPQEVSVLIEAAARGIPARLLAGGGWPSAGEREALIAALTEQSGLALRPATWAVGVWCEALLGSATAAEVAARQSSSRVSDRPGSLAAVFGQPPRETLD